MFQFWFFPTVIFNSVIPGKIGKSNVVDMLGIVDVIFRFLPGIHRRKVDSGLKSKALRAFDFPRNDGL